MKSQFYEPSPTQLIKAMSPFESFCIDFKGPLPSSSSSKSYILTIVDLFSRFLFAYPCRAMSSSTVINCLSHLFSIFGLPAYIHSDSGASFMSFELKRFLTDLGVTTPYNSRGNSQCERYNAVIYEVEQCSTCSGKPQLEDQCLGELYSQMRSIPFVLSSARQRMRHRTSACSAKGGETLPTNRSRPGSVNRGLYY